MLDNPTPSVPAKNVSDYELSDQWILRWRHFQIVCKWIPSVFYQWMVVTGFGLPVPCEHLLFFYANLFLYNGRNLPKTIHCSNRRGISKIKPPVWYWNWRGKPNRSKFLFLRRCSTMHKRQKPSQHVELRKYENRLENA